MKRLLVYFALVAVVFTACTTIKYIPVKETEYVTIKDSVYFRDTTVQYQIEKEYVKEYAKDTLRLSTKYSDFTAYQDTLSGLLSGYAKNKEKLIDIPMSVKEKIVYKDSIVTKEVPVPVEVEKKVKFVPWYAKILSWIGGLALIALIVYFLLAYLRRKPI